jgi:hypothetical protein
VAVEGVEYVETTYVVEVLCPIAIEGSERLDGFWWLEDRLFENLDGISLLIGFGGATARAVRRIMAGHSNG